MHKPKILARIHWKDLSGQKKHKGKTGVLDLSTVPGPVLESFFPLIERVGSLQEVTVAINKT